MPEVIGYLLTINAVISWALASLVYKFGLGKTEAKANIFFRLVIVSGSTLILAIIFGSFLFLINLTHRDLIIYFTASSISGISVTLGDLAYFYSLKKIDASRAYPLTQLSLVFVYPLAFFLFREKISISILIGGIFILSSVFFLSKKDKPKESSIYVSSNNDESSKPVNKSEKETKDLFIGVFFGILTALLWSIAIVSFNQARIIHNDVFVINFFRLFIATIFTLILGIFQGDFFLGFQKEQRPNLKYYLYIGIAGTLTLGLADTLFYKAAEINGLVLTSTITANTPMVQQILSIVLLKEKFRKRFIFAVFLIICGNFLIIFF